MATDGHPFFDATASQFVLAEDLAVGHLLRRSDGSLVAIAAVVLVDRPMVAYNLTVAGIHTYQVGKDGILSHNGCASIPGRPFRGSSAPQEAYKHLGRYHGIDPTVASNRLHIIKGDAGLGAADDVVIGRTGGVYDARTGERLGSLTDRHLGRAR
jgi:hypothetical protein